MTRPTRPSPPTRDTVRRSIADDLLSALAELVARHRALALHGDDAGEHIELHAELIAAEVAHQLALARAALHRHPSLQPPPAPTNRTSEP